MKTRCLPFVYRLCIWAMAAVLLWIPAEADAVFYQKNYIVKHFRGKDVLCDPYTVRQNDYVIKILKQRGDIAHKDFPRFLKIFRHVNPDIGDIDLIYPQQQILIPLRILEPGTLSGQESGKVSIPVITITNLPAALKRYSEIYKIRYGDWVSKLISERFGRYGSEAYQRGIELFKKLNPDIKDLDRIRAGEKVRLPEPEIRSQPWYDDLFEKKEPSAEKTRMWESEAVSLETEEKKIPKVQEISKEAFRGKKSEKPEPVPSPPPPVQWFKDLSVFARAAEILGGELLDKGQYFFPGNRESDYSLDLSKTPVLEFKDGKKFLFTRRQWLSPGGQAIIQNYWEELEIVFVSGEPELSFLLENIIGAIDPDGYENRVNLNDNGVLVAVRGQYIYNNSAGGAKICLNIISEPDMRTPQAVRDYLGGHDIRIREWVEKKGKSGWVLAEPEKKPSKQEIQSVGPRNPAPLVRAVTRMLGYKYHENVEVSFPYAGFQVKATTDMLSLGEQAEMLVDYGDLQGDAVSAIEKTGFKVLQIKGRNMEQVIETLTGLLPVTLEEDPIFWAAERPRIYNTSIETPGWLVSGPEKSEGIRLLLSETDIADGLADYLENQGIGVIRILK